MVTKRGKEDKYLVLRLQHAPSLHVLGGLKIDPPGSTRCWCCLLPKPSAGDTKRSVWLLKQVSASIAKLGGACQDRNRRVECGLHDFELGVEGVASM